MYNIRAVLHHYSPIRKKDNMWGMNHNIDWLNISVIDSDSDLQKDQGAIQKWRSCRSMDTVIPFLVSISFTGQIFEFPVV